MPVRPEPDPLLEHLGPGDGGEGGGGPGPDPGGVMGRHLCHPVIVLPRPANSDPLLTGDDVDVIRVEGGLDPGSLHPQHLASEREHSLVVTQPPRTEAGAVDHEVAASFQVREVLTQTLKEHPTCN